ncbi:MAG: energy transducer TonB [Halioglobus sp.]
MVYTYDIDIRGEVVNLEIHTSSGVTEVEQRVLDHVAALRFSPATRDGQPVKVSLGPVVFTWILDIPRVMAPQFKSLYEQAWSHFKAQQYDAAAEVTRSLEQWPGRNAYEEVKYRILAASLASRDLDDGAEQTHLNRIVDFQELADRNNFNNPYVVENQYLLMLDRIHSLQLAKKLLGDAQLTLNNLIARDRDAQITLSAQKAQQEAQSRLLGIADVSLVGKLSALYPGAQGLWETQLFREKFLITNAAGTIASVHLSCKSGGDQRLIYPSAVSWKIPPGWQGCKLEIAGTSDTRFTLHQQL